MCLIYCKKIKWSLYRPGVAQRVGRGIALLFHDRDTRRGWVVSSTPRPHFTSGKDRYPFYRRLGGPQGRSGRAGNLVPTGIYFFSIPDRPARRQSLYWLSYPAHTYTVSCVLMNSRLKGKVHRSLTLVPQWATVRVAHSTTTECFFTTLPYVRYHEPS